MRLAAPEARTTPGLGGSGYVLDAEPDGGQAGWGDPQARAVKEISVLEMLVKVAGRFAAVSGVIALLIWITWVMLDIKNLQSGFTLP